MERCAAIQVTEPEELRGGWLEKFPGYEKLYLELGCGKGRFTADTADSMRSVLLVAVERVREAMVVAMERCLDRGLENARFIDCDAVKLTELFAPGEVERIYINFCDPWPHKRHAKRRLTAPGFLALYAQVLPVDGEIHFKTDNRPLFDFSLESFKECGWTLSEITYDLHADGPCGVMTDYEAKFYEQGVPINRCVARPPVKKSTEEERKDD